MLKRMTAWLQTKMGEPQAQETEHTVALCTAVLLYEIMRADDKFEQQEREVLDERLREHVAIPEQERRELVEMATHQAHQAADFVQFTRVINQQCGQMEKRAIMESLWHVAFADGHLDAHEEHLIRRIADLLYVPHSQFIQSKLAASPEDPPE